jgi:hypothetical protein
MQKEQRRSHPLNATAKVGINSSSSETSTCAEKMRAVGPAWQRPSSPASLFTPHSWAHNLQWASASIAAALRAAASSVRLFFFCGGQSVIVVAYREKKRPRIPLRGRGSLRDRIFQPCRRWRAARPFGAHPREAPPRRWLKLPSHAVARCAWSARPFAGAEVCRRFIRAIRFAGNGMRRPCERGGVCLARRRRFVR